MIKGSFKRTGSGRIVSFELTGHAEAGPYGSDVVCAAVSALAISTVNGIDALAGFEPIVEVEDVEGGYLYVEMLTTVNQEQKNNCPNSIRKSFIRFTINRERKY